MRAIILAGGKGTRLRPYTVVFPKPLMPIGNHPILEVVIRQLAYYKFTHITIAVNYQADLIKSFFGDGNKWGVKIDYSMEDKPLSTMGPLTLIKDLPEDFLIMNGDILTDLNFKELYLYHVSHKNLFTISSSQREVKNDYGVLDVKEDGELTGFCEKPVVKYDVSMGVYVANKRILDYIPENEAYGFDNLMLRLIESNNLVNVKRFNGYWLDIGRHGDYLQAIEVFEKKEILFLKD